MDEKAEISSLANPRVKQVVKLRKRRERDKSGLYVIDGYREISRALACKQCLDAVFFCPDLGGDLLQDADFGEGVQRYFCTRAVFEKMAYREHPDGFLAVAHQRPLTLGDLELSRCPLLLVATAIEKPSNLGAMLRTADGAGVDAVLVCDPVTDLYNPNVVRASTGTFFSVPSVVVDSAIALDWLRGHNIQRVCTSPDTEQLYHEADLTRPTAIVMGSEKDGLPPEWLYSANVNVRIPMHGVADSLNVSASAALVVYEALRQRAQGPSVS